MKTTVLSLLMACGVLSAQAPQAPNPTRQVAIGPVYRVTVVARTMKAINYNHRSGSTMIGMQGTALMPSAKGDVKVESKQGVIKIDADMSRLGPATNFGSEYLTYVMWAITPEGRATNVGEVLLNGRNSHLNATTELQSFGLIVTAEPYFAVTQPSNVVVMENFVRKDTQGTIEQLDAKYELLPRGQYVLNVKPSDITPFKLNSNVPLEVYEARNALQIARWTGAEQYAASTFLKATQGLQNAEGFLKSNTDKKRIGTVARESVQMSEDARIISIKKMTENSLQAERQAGAAREFRAEAGREAAQSETERVKSQALSAQFTAQAAADRVKRDNDAQAAAAQATANGLRQDNANQTLAAQVEADRVKRNTDAQTNNTQMATDRLKQENDAKLAAALTDADRAKRESAAQVTIARLEADRVKRATEAQTDNAQAEANRLRAANDTKLAATQVELVAAQIETARIAQESDARNTAAKNEAERLRQDNEAQKMTAQAAIDALAKDKKKLEKDRTALRAALLLQFNTILQTRDTARGLIVNMSDVIFDTGRFSLLPGAREKLSKVAGIISGHPGLTLSVEGHTDSVGNDVSNQKLSEQRGGAVRDYLVKQGMAVGSVSSKGFGATQPVATNANATGRQQNRRVEIVISGDIIGQEIAIPIATR